MLLPLACAAFAAELVLPPISSIPATVLSAPPSEIEAGAFSERQASSRATLVTELEAVALWSSKNRAYLERDKTYELILEFEESNKAARSALKYIRDSKTKEWIRPRPYRQPKNAAPEAAIESAAKRQTVLEAHVERMVSAVEACATMLETGIKNKALGALLPYAPDNEHLRMSLGQVRFSVGGGSDRWVSKDSAATLKRRAELASWRASARAMVPELKTTDLQTEEASLGDTLSWTYALQSGSLRLLSTGNESEARNLLTDMQVMRAYMPKVLGGQYGPVEDANIYLLPTSGSSTDFRDKFPFVSQANRSAWGGQVGTFLGTTPHCAIYASSPDLRRDITLRLATSLYLVRNYGIRAHKRGWVVEGFGLYLVHQIAGTRLSFTRGSDPKEAPRSGSKSRRNANNPLGSPDADWLANALASIQSGELPKLAFVLGKSAEAMTPNDAVVANALAAYLIEALGPEVTEQVLTRIGGQWKDGKQIKAGEASALVLEDVFGLPLKEIYPTIARWVTEISSNE